MSHAPAASRGFDLVALGEVMLRLDPGEGRIRCARTFQAWEGGGEYNVARGLRRCFGMRTAVVTALVDNEIGRLVEDLILQGGVDTSFVSWTPFDGVGSAARNGLNFTERGFGLRQPVGVSDRGHTAIAQLPVDGVDWDELFGGGNVRWLHTGGVFAGLSESTPLVAARALEAARRHGVRTSFDLNFRPSLWRSRGGAESAVRVMRALVEHVDVLIGNEEDYELALGYEIEGLPKDRSQLPTNSFEALLSRLGRDLPSLEVAAVTLRQVKTASVNDWSALAWGRTEGMVSGRLYHDLAVLDRVGGGDSFAAGLIYGLLTGRPLKDALAYGIAHGALAITTPGDTSMASLADVERVMRGGSARITR